MKKKDNVYGSARNEGMSSAESKVNGKGRRADCSKVKIKMDEGIQHQCTGLGSGIRMPGVVNREW